jgi:hypothetical protein
MAERARSPRRSGHSTAQAPPENDRGPRPVTAGETAADVAAERALARAVSWALPLATGVGAIAVGVFGSLGSAILVIASGVLLGAIALLWASLRTLSGDAPLLDAPSNGAQRVATSDLGERKLRVLLALKDIESEHQLGKLDDADYQTLVARYREEAKDVLREIDRRAAPSRAEAERVASEYLARHGMARAGATGGATGGDGNAPAAETKSAPAAGRIECSSCHGSNEPDAAFCKHCGASMNGPAPSTEGAHHAKA